MSLRVRKLECSGEMWQVEGAADDAVDAVGVAAVGLGVSERGGRLTKARCALRASSMEWPAIFPPVEMQKSVVWFVLLQLAQRSLGAVLLLPETAARAVLLGESSL